MIHKLAWVHCWETGSVRERENKKRVKEGCTQRLLVFEQCGAPLCNSLKLL
jgi:hypothetical protein